MTTFLPSIYLLKSRPRKDFVTLLTFFDFKICSKTMCKSRFFELRRCQLHLNIFISVFEAFKNLKGNKRIPPNEFDLQHGYKERSKPETYPFRAAGSGENGGLTFEIWRNFSEVKKSKNSNKGFKLVVHLPSEIPQFDKQYFRFPLEKAATLVIRPSYLATEDSLKSTDYKTRQCFFEGEKKLQLFKNYTRSNCQLECLAEFTRRRCKCIHYSMPRLRGDHVCDSESFDCYVKAKKDLMQQSMEQGLGVKKNKSDTERVEMDCLCLPSCTSLSYEGEISDDDMRYFDRKHGSS